MTGIEAAEKIRQTDSSVILIFLTTSEEHRADAFRCHAYDYLVKPVQKKSLFRTMDDILRLNTAPEAEQLMFSSQRRSYSIAYADLVFIRTESNETNYLEISECSGSIYRTRMTFSMVKDILSKDRRFLQIQRGVLINLEHLAFIKDTCCVMDNGQSLPISVKKEKEIRQIWQNYMFDNIRRQSRRL